MTDNHKREMDRLRQQRKRAKDKPKADGPVRVTVTVANPAVLRAAWDADERASLVALVEQVIDDDCRAYIKKQTAEQWEKVSKQRTGYIEMQGEFNKNGNWTVIKPKKVPPHIAEMVKPNDMTDEQWELVENEMMEAWHEQMEADDHDYDNPETGESRRVNTSHNWERDR